MSGKLLFHSNAPWSSTGYGQQTKLFAPRLAEYYDLTISAFYGLEGAPLEMNESIKVLPGVEGKFGNETILAHARSEFGGDLRGGLVMTLMDVQVLDPRVWGQMNVCSWVPVDHQPAPDDVRGYFAASKAIPIAMSRFGEEQLAEFDPLYVPHGIDCRAFHPVDKREARETIGIDPDAFIVGVVAANIGNPSRKCLPEMLQAFTIFRESHPEAKLYLHTEWLGKHNGVPLPPLIESLGLPEDSIILSDQYRYEHNPMPPDMLRTLYSSFDVLLATSRGEGFGITVLEAQACGVPAIVSDFSAQPEVCGAGWHVSGRPEWTYRGSWMFLPDIEDTVDALKRAYALPQAAREQMAREAREHAETYDVDKVMAEHMLPALSEAQDRFEDRPVELVA